MKVNREGGGVQSRPLRMKDEAKAGQTISRTGKGGKLRNIMNMPIEVFAEVRQDKKTKLQILTSKRSRSVPIWTHSTSVI